MGRGRNHLQIAVEMLNVVSLRFLRFEQLVDRLLGALTPDRHRTNIASVSVEHRRDVEVQLYGSNLDDRLVREFMRILMRVGSHDFVDV